MNLSIILNEKKYALSCIQERSIGESSWMTAQILAKYYYWELGYRKKKIEKELTEFISECDSQYRKNKQRWEENIEKLAANAGNYPLFKDDYVPITERELKKIQDSDLSKQHQQVLFTYLCLAKLGNMRNEKNNGWVNYKTRDVFKLAHVSLSELNQDIMDPDLCAADRDGVIHYCGIYAHRAFALRCHPPRRVQPDSKGCSGILHNRHLLRHDDGIAGRHQRCYRHRRHH